MNKLQIVDDITAEDLDELHQLNNQWHAELALRAILDNNPEKAKEYLYTLDDDYLQDVSHAAALLHTLAWTTAADREDQQWPQQSSTTSR